MLTLTENALAAVRHVLADAGAEALRIGVESKGCAGQSYHLALIDDPEDGDALVECSGVKVYVEAASALLLAGLKVDYVDTVAGAGFVFENPNAKAQCACGKSFC